MDKDTGREAGRNADERRKDADREDTGGVDERRRSGPHGDGPLKGRYKRDFVEVVCPRCRTTRIIVVPEESMPRCENCRVEMLIKEVLTEGKY